MLTYVLRRALMAVPVLFGISVLSFIMLHMLPGDPASALMSLEERVAAPAIVEARRQELGLNDPLPIQYLAWLRELLRGNVGYSFRSRIPVTQVVGPRVMPTVLLAASSVGVALPVGMAIGTFAALRQKTWFDYVSATGSMLAISIPNFFQALVAIFVFSLWLGVLPSGGMRTVGIEPTTLDLLRHLVLPAGVLASVLVGPYVRFTRQSLLDALRQDYITTAYAKGVPRRGVIIRHALRNSLIPLTTVVALEIPALLAGAVIIEVLFSWPGMGRLVLDSILARDYPVILALVMLTAVLVMVFNFLADIVAAILDPRIRQ